MLREEEGREINHHGRVRQLDAEGNEIFVVGNYMKFYWIIEACKDGTVSDVEPIKIMDDGKGGFNIDLISRHENKQESEV